MKLCKTHVRKTARRVVFEQVYWTCLRMTDPFQSDMGCRYPLKLFNITLTANPSHPFRQVHAPVVQTEVPKEAEAKNNPGFFLKFHYATRSRSFEKLRWLDWIISCVWFTDWTSLTQLHGQRNLAQWHEPSKILKVISGSPRGCFAWHASWGSAGDALTNTSHASNTQSAFSVWIWRKVLLFPIHPIDTSWYIT